MRGTTRWMVLATVAAALGWTWSVWAQTSPYDSLDPGRLARALRQRGMTELLEEFSKTLTAGKGADSVQVLQMTAEQNLALATQPNVTDAKRKAFRQAAADAYKKLFEKISPKLKEIMNDRECPSDDARLALKYFQYWYRYGEIVGIVQAAPHAEKLIALEGGDEDRKIIADKTQQAAEIFAELNNSLEETIQTWRTIRRLLVWAVPEAEALQMQAKYKSAFVFFYSGMSLPNDKANREERRARLDDAIRGVRTWAEGDDDFGVKYWSLLLMGMAQRELGQYKEAVATLQRAAEVAIKNADGSPNPDGKQIRMDAHWNIVRAHVEGADYKAAQAAIGAFKQAVAKMYPGQDVSYGVDLKAALLEEYMYRTQGRRNKDKAAKFNEMAALALLRVPAKHNEANALENWAGIIRRKFGADDERNAASVYAGAIGPLQKWRLAEDKSAVPEAVKKKAQDKLNKIINGKGADFDYARPMALWQSAWTQIWSGQNIQAAESFLRLAKQYKDHPQAKKAADYGCRLYLAVIADRLRGGKAVLPNLRRGLIEAGELQLAHWAKDAKGNWDPAVCKRYLDVGTQYEKLIKTYPEEIRSLPDAQRRIKQREADIEKMVKAAQAYDHYVTRANPGEVAKMRARSAALEMRYAEGEERTKLAKLQGDEADASRVWASRKESWAQNLVSDLTKYGEDAKQAIQNATDAKEKQELAERGALAEFRAGQILYQVLAKKAQAQSKIAELPKRWPGTRVVIDANEFLIRMDILDNRTADAIQKLKVFKAEAEEANEPQRYEGLVAAIIHQLNLRIKDLRLFLQGKPNDQNAKQSLTRFRRDFYTFSKTLFEPLADLPLKQRYDNTKLYASGLLENGEADIDDRKKDSAEKCFEEARKLFLECQALDEARRKEMGKLIDKWLEGWKKKISATKTVEQATKLYEEYKKELKKHTGIVPTEDPSKPDRISGPMAIKAGLDYVKAGAKSIKEEENVAAIKARMPTFIERATNAFAQIADIRKNSLPMDMDVLLGLARAYRNLGQFRKAAEYYNNIVRAIDRKRQPDLYWPVELEYERAILKGFGDDKNMMRTLYRRIQRLRRLDKAEDGNMGGLHRQFSQVETEAKAKAGD